MNKSQLQALVRRPEAASQLLDQLPRMPDGVQQVTVRSGSRKLDLRVVRLTRIGNKLYRTSNYEEDGDAV